MKLDANSITTILSWLGGLLVMAIAGWLAYRRGADLVLKRAAEEYKTLSEAQGKRIGVLESAITVLDDALAKAALEKATLTARNDELIRLNLALQVNNMEEKNRSSKLEARIEELERAAHRNG